MVLRYDQELILDWLREEPFELFDYSPRFEKTNGSVFAPNLIANQ
jgi:hypothetical protein